MDGVRTVSVGHWTVLASRAVDSVSRAVDFVNRAEVGDSSFFLIF